MRRRIITHTLAPIALIICMTAGWHTWPLAIGLGIVLGLHAAGYRMADDRPVSIDDAELYRWLQG